MEGRPKSRWRSFWEGFSRAFDLFGTSYSPRKPKVFPYKIGDVFTDAEAIRKDWEVIEEDLRVAMQKFESELPPKLKKKLRKLRRNSQTEK